MTTWACELDGCARNAFRSFLKKLLENGYLEEWQDGGII